MIRKNPKNPFFRDDYDNIGQFYSRLSGNTRFIELELIFDSHTTLSDISGIEHRIKTGLSEHFPDMVFRLIPIASSIVMPSAR